MTVKPRALRSLILVGIVTSHGVLLAAPIRFLPWDEGIAARKLGFQNGKETGELQNLHPLQRSKPMDGTQGEAPLQLVALDRKSPDGKPVAIEIKGIDGLQSPLVLLLPDPKHPTGLRTFAIEDNASKFSWGSMRFINATGKPLLIRHEQSIKALPGTWTPVDIDPGGSPRNFGVQVVAAADLKTILYSAIWEYHPDVRKLAFILPGADAGGGVIAFKIIPEDRRMLAAAAAAEKAERSSPAPPANP